MRPGKRVHEALRESVERMQRAGYSVDFLADTLNIPTSSFYQMCEPPESNRVRLKAEQVPLIHRVCGPEVIRALCALCDGTFRPNAKPVDTNEIVVRELPRFMHEWTEYIGKVTAALQDGLITPEEAAEIHKGFNEMMNAATQFAAVFDATARESRKGSTNGRARTLAEAFEFPNPP